MSSSPDYKSFFESFFPTSYAEAKEGLDVEALQRLKGKERAQAEHLLLVDFQEHDSPTAAQGLGLLKSKAAAEILSTQVEHLSGQKAVAAYYALYRITGDPQTLQKLSEQFFQCHTWNDVIDCLMLFFDRALPPDFSRDLLLRCLDTVWGTESDYLIRYNALRVIVHLFGKSNEISIYDPKFEEKALVIVETLRY